MSVTPIHHRGMTPSAARQLTDSIKADAETLWQRLLHAYEQGAHTALGYPSWGAYCKYEFGTGSTHSYQLLNAGRVKRAIETHSAIAERPRSEGVVRQLVPVLRKEGEEAVSEAWAEVVDEHGPEPTAAEVRSVVEKSNKSVVKRALGPRGRKGSKLSQQQQQFTNVLSSMQIGAEHISAGLANRTNADKRALSELLDVDEQTFEAWNEMARAVENAAHKLRRYLGRTTT